jgi:hypothetical protein
MAARRQSCFGDVIYHLGGRVEAIISAAGAFEGSKE